MQWISGLSRRVRVVAAIVISLGVIGAMQGDKPATEVAATATNVVDDPIAESLPRATIKERRSVPTTLATTTTAAPTTTAYIPPSTRVSVQPAPSYRAAPPTQPPAAPAAGNCHPSYDPCIAPTGGDVDCAGGSGNGPRYVEGPVSVHGNDEYDLDRDGDGVACEG